MFMQNTLQRATALSKCNLKHIVFRQEKHAHCNFVSVAINILYCNITTLLDTVGDVSITSTARVAE